MIDAAAAGKAIRSIARSLASLDPETRAFVLSAFGITDEHEAWKAWERKRKSSGDQAGGVRKLPEENGSHSGGAGAPRVPARG